MADIDMRRISICEAFENDGETVHDFPTSTSRPTSPLYSLTLLKYISSIRINLWISSKRSFDWYKVCSEFLAPNERTRCECASNCCCQLTLFANSRSRFLSPFSRSMMVVAKWTSLSELLSKGWIGNNNNNRWLIEDLGEPLWALMIDGEASGRVIVLEWMSW